MLHFLRYGIVLLGYYCLSCGIVLTKIQRTTFQNKAKSPSPRNSKYLIFDLTNGIYVKLDRKQRLLSNSFAFLAMPKIRIS